MIVNRYLGKSIFLTLAVLHLAWKTVAGRAPSSWMFPEGTTAVVTGGTKGIGKAIVQELAAMRVHVFTCARSPDDLKRCLDEWREAGLAVDGAVANVAEAEDRQNLTKAISSWLGTRKLDILVNNEIGRAHV